MSARLSAGEASDVGQLLAASACRGQFSSSMPESYSSSGDSLVGALEFRREVKAGDSNGNRQREPSGSEVEPDVSGLGFSLDRVFVHLNRNDVGVRNLKHGVQKQLFLGK